MKILKCAILALTLLSVSCASIARPRTDEATLQARAYTLACAWSKYDCSGIERPYVVYDATAGEMSAYGYYYMGDDTIYLDDDLINDPYRLVVLVHEMVHYLQAKTGTYQWPYTHEKSCAQESEAFTVARKVAKAVFGPGYNEAPTWETMDEYYGCESTGMKNPR